MTYCVAVMLDAGMVFASDSRTNAGVDQIATFSKMHLVVRNGERTIAILSSGNLSITQSAINLLEHQSKSGDANRTINNASSMYEIADLIGNALREVRRRDGPYLAQNNIESHASFVVGGQILGRRGGALRAASCRSARRSRTSMPRCGWCGWSRHCATGVPAG